MLALFGEADGRLHYASLLVTLWRAEAGWRTAYIDGDIRNHQRIPSSERPKRAP